MKIKSYLFLLLSLFLFSHTFLLAQLPPPENLPPPEIPGSFFSCEPTDPLRICILKLTGDALRVIIVLALVFAAVMIGWSGLRYIFSRGQTETLNAIKSSLIFAAVGLVVAFLSWVVTVILSMIIGSGQSIQ